MIRSSRAKGALALAAALTLPSWAATATPATPATPAPPPGAPAAAAAPNPDAPKPVLVIDAPKIDLGVIKEGQDAVATFTLRNTGQAELRILAARPG